MMDIVYNEGKVMMDMLVNRCVNNFVKEIQKKFASMAEDSEERHRTTRGLYERSPI